MFKPAGQADFPKLEQEVLEFWKNDNTFEKSVQARKGGKEFVFYDGPPFATGLPHYGHLLAGTIKDVVPRYQTMRGRYCERTFGWDCHGLPVEYEMEKELKLSGKREIETFGVDKFNEACRGIVLRYTSEWERIVTRMGRWVDFRNGYRTMDRDYMESIWWVFKQLWDQDLIYEGYKILPYCARCCTPLSNFEANQGYADVEDPAITIRFKVVGEENTYFLAWTTTPWTLPSNMALTVGPEIDYVKVLDDGTYYIMAEARLSAYYKKDLPEIVARFKGSELADKHYEPLFPYFANMAEQGAFRVITADFVSTEDGTGIVHTAPGFGEDDAAAGKAHGVPGVCPIDAECKFTNEVPDYVGRFVKETDKDIIKRLKDEGKLVHRGTIKHSYPHCWRDDSPLIYKAVSTWFVRIDRIKEKMINANKQMSWVPEHIKNGRFGKWLENARDWAISRNRYWGCPLPIWRNEETGEMICVGSVKELEELTGRKFDDIHKHYVDNVEIVSPKTGAILKRIPEVLDCWFESGSMPYAQKHYPFENKERFDANYPADFIAEGLDQTRGWFYTLVVLAAALFDKPPAMNVVVNGLILASNGQKMSKRLKNYPDPLDVVNVYGADALRLFLLGSPVVRAEDLKFSEEGIKEVLRGVLLPIWNSYSFFTTYASVDNWVPAPGPLKAPENPANPLDRWILSSLSDMVEEIRAAMDAYQLQRAANRFEKFADDLTNWYIRRSRRRFWKSKNDGDKNDAYGTLYYVLMTFVKCAAPFIPMLTEKIYRGLRTEDMPGSVHLCDFPEPETDRRDTALECQMENTMRAVTLGHFLRKQKNLKIRQPLAKAILVAADPKVRALLEGTKDIVAEELDVKEILIRDSDAELVTLSAKANFKVLGAKLGPKMKAAAAEIAKLSADSLRKLESGETVAISLDGETIELAPGEVTVLRAEKPGVTAATEAGLTIALDTELTRELLDEGIAREFISKVQNLRKEMDLQVSDRITVAVASDEEAAKAILAFRDYVSNETLALDIIAGEIAADKKEEADLNGHNAVICVKKGAL